jgi:hypothetical protein
LRTGVKRGQGSVVAFSCQDTVFGNVSSELGWYVLRNDDGLRLSLARAKESLVKKHPEMEALREAVQRLEVRAGEVLEFRRHAG